MKKLLIALSLLFFINFQEGNAQQIHQLTQYMVNDFAFNPAVAGHSTDLISKFTYRRQWAGIEDGPKTTLFSAHGNFSKKRSIGLGMLLYNDVTGPTRRTGGQLAYAYHVPIEEDETYLGIGIAAAFMQYRLDYDQLIFAQPDDPQIGDGPQSKFNGDAHFGLYLRNPKYWVGASVNQLLASKIQFNGIESDALIQNARHFYLTGGYRFFLNDEEDWGIEPSLLLKMVKGAPAQFDLNVRAFYQNQYWLGLAYRTQDALAILVGLDLDSGLNLTYSYDITTSGLNVVSNGSHEFTVGYNLDLQGKNRRY